MPQPRQPQAMQVDVPRCLAQWKQVLFLGFQVPSHEFDDPTAGL